MVNEHSGEQQSIRTKTEDGVDHDRRELLAAFTTVAGASAMALLSQSAQAQSESTPVPRRALTGRDASGKVRFQVVRCHSTGGYVSVKSRARVL